MRDPEYRTYFQECSNRNAGYQATWSIPAESRWPRMTEAEAWENAMMRNGCRYDAVQYYAHFGEREGIAERTTTGACWFTDDSDGVKTLLHAVDSASLMLFGRCDLVPKP